MAQAAGQQGAWGRTAHGRSERLRLQTSATKTIESRSLRLARCCWARCTCRSTPACAAAFVFGLDYAPKAFIGLLQGKNFGKLVILVAHE